MNILVVDDHTLFRDGLVTMLNSQPDMTVVGEAASVKEAIEKARQLRPSHILMDYSLPDGSGLEATQKISAEFPEMKIIFLTIHDEVEHLLGAIRAGAKGYLLKDLPFSKLVISLRSLENDEAPISRKMTMQLLEKFRYTANSGQTLEDRLADFSSREIQVLRELANDATNEEIAKNLSITVPTVKNHIHKILLKLNCQNRHDAARFARHQGLGTLVPFS